MTKGGIPTDEITNMEKYGNYKEQMDRLKKAMDNHFLLEAVFIEYAIMEDRCESLLRHSGVFNPKKHNMISKKLKSLEELTENNASLIRKYISAELLQQISAWKDERNRLIHALMKQSLTSEEIEDLAEQGREIVKTLCSKATSYKRALERAQKQMEEQVK